MSPASETAAAPGCAVLRAKKLKGKGIVRVAVAHNRRAIVAELGAGSGIDPTRSHLNECLAGQATPVEVAASAMAAMQAAQIVTERLRSDCVRAVEFVVSLAPEHGIDERGFFSAALAWLAARFGGVGNILSADIHRDEAAPHMHVLLLPLIGGRMAGSDALGGRAKFGALLTGFHAEVAAPYGLQRPKPRLYGSAKVEGVRRVLQWLKAKADPAMHSALWVALRDSIERDPGPFLAALGVTAPEARKKPLRTMTAIFTSKGKGSDATQEEQPYRVRRAVRRAATE